VKATVRNAAAIECGDKCRPDRATVLVFIDQARVADDAEKPTVFGNRIKLMMVEQDGRWLVDNIDAL
jgi:Mce-associated membrane protein